MSHVAIRAAGVSKRYSIGEETNAYGTLRDVIANAVRRRLRRSHRRLRRHIWALRGISLEVQRGEVIGIIGRNGAGKSTLLKILSRITEPTRGYAEVHGRIGSLLEVGTGFHYELTGRENTYLNGAILGMGRREIQRKFDEIVAFSELQKFIDTPVKFYSSGMYMRLAFAVAAHLDPEILLVDEVLAVGDIAFQKKCIGKMGEAAKGGRTILFVSHNMTSVRQLCSKVLWIERGSTQAFGDVLDVVQSYECSGIAAGAMMKNRVYRSDPPLDAELYTEWIELRDGKGAFCNRFRYGEIAKIRFKLKGKVNASSFNIAWFIRDSDSNTVSSGLAHQMRNACFASQERNIELILGPFPLAAGQYIFSLDLRVEGLRHLDIWDRAVQFEITHCDPYQTGHNYRSHPGLGSCFIPHKWDTAR